MDPLPNGDASTLSASSSSSSSGAAKALLPAAAPGPPPRWHQIPNEMLVLIFGFLGTRDRVVCSRVCRRWREIFLADAFGGQLYFDASSRPFHDYFLRRLGQRARKLVFFDLESVSTMRLLNASTGSCDRDVLRSFVLAGDEVKGAFRVTPTSTPHSGVSAALLQHAARETTTATEGFMLPLLCGFLRRRTYPHEALYDQMSTMDQHLAAFDQDVAAKRGRRTTTTTAEGGDECDGFAFEHIGLINLRLTATDDFFYQGDHSLWSFVRRHSGASLKMLDLIYLTNRMYLPDEFFAFRALEQLCISTNHLHSKPLTTFTSLPNLNHLIVYVGKRPSPGTDAFSLDEEAWKSFHEAKPATRLSFILKTQKDVRDNIPRHVPIHGLEVVSILDVDLRDLMSVLGQVAHLALVYVGVTDKAILEFFDSLINQGPPAAPGAKRLRTNSNNNNNNNGVVNGVCSPPRLAAAAAASSSSSTPPPVADPPLPRLRRFQYGGNHPADFYLRLAHRVRQLSPDLREWVVSMDNVSFYGAHSTMAHGSRRDAHASRVKVGECTAPPDDRCPMLCSTSSPATYRRRLTASLPPATLLRAMTRRAFLGTSLFWKTDMEILRQLRNEPASLRNRRESAGE